MQKTLSMLGVLEETDLMLFIIICLWKPASLIMAGGCPQELSILFVFSSQAFQQAESHWMSPPDRWTQNYETTKFNVRTIEEWVLEGRGSRGDLGDMRQMGRSQCGVKGIGPLVVMYPLSLAQLISFHDREKNVFSLACSVSPLSAASS